MRLWRPNGHSIYQTPRTNDPRATPWVGDGTKNTSIERWSVTYPDTTANDALYFIMFAHGPFEILGTLYLLFDAAISIRCKDGDTLSFSYPGFQGTWQSADGHLTFQDTDPPPTSRPVTFKHVNVVDPGTPSHALTISVSGLTATITLATNGSSVVTTTNTQLKTAWDADTTAHAWAQLFITSGSSTVNADSGDLHGDYSHSFSTTASNLSWTKEYDSYIAGTPFFGTGSFLRISKQTGTYSTAGDRFQVFGPPGDNPVGDWSTGLSVAQVMEATITDWVPMGTPPVWVRCTNVSAPSTAVAGADISVTFNVVDAIAGTPQSEPSEGGQLLPQLNPDPIPDPLEIISTGSGTSITDHIKIKYVGPWIYSPVVGDNMSKSVFSNVINVTPGAPDKPYVDDSYVSRPFTGWRATSTDNDDVPTFGLTNDPGEGVQSVGHGKIIEVFLKDQFGNVCTDAAGKHCTLSIHETGSPLVPVGLSGTLTRPFVNGVARFDDLIVTGLSVTSQLRATYVEGPTHQDYQFQPAIFGFFKLSQPSLAPNQAVTIQYLVCDYWGNLLDLLAHYDPVTLTDGTSPGGFTGNGTVTPINGVATFVGHFPAAGEFNLRASGSQARYVDTGSYSPTIKVA